MRGSHWWHKRALPRPHIAFKRQFRIHYVATVPEIQRMKSIGLLHECQCTSSQKETPAPAMRFVEIVPVFHLALVTFCCDPHTVAARGLNNQLMADSSRRTDENGFATLLWWKRRRRLPVCLVNPSRKLNTCASQTDRM